MLQALPLRPSMLELWLLKVQAALQAPGWWSAFLAQQDIDNMLSQARAARQDAALRPIVDLRAELQTAIEDAQDAASDMRKATSVLRAEFYHGGRTRLTDCLIVTSEPRAESVGRTAQTLELIDTLLDRVDALKALPQELDALLKGAAHIPERR